MKTIEWMRSYFDRVGDKRPDKDGIYLPTCLTERLIYNLMIKDLRWCVSLNLINCIGNTFLKYQFPRLD
jgi:hypothetical protein